MQKMRLVWAVLAATLPVGRLAGAPSAIFDQTTFSGFEQVVTFNSIGNGIAITTEFSEQGVIFGGGLFGMTNGGDLAQFPDNGGGVIASDWVYSQSSNPTLPWTATFTVPAIRAGFLVEANSGDTTQITTILGGTPTGTVSLLSVGTTAVFFGVEDPAGFDSISVTVTGPSNHFLAIDDFRFEAVPEPTTAALLAAGLCGLAVRIGRRRRRKVFR